MILRLPAFLLSSLLLSAWFVIGFPSLAQQQVPANQPMTNVQFPNTPVPVILLEYERLTGKRVIRDAAACFLLFKKNKKEAKRLQRETPC